VLCVHAVEEVEDALVFGAGHFACWRYVIPSPFWELYADTIHCQVRLGGAQGKLIHAASHMHWLSGLASSAECASLSRSDSVVMINAVVWACLTALYIPARCTKGPGGTGTVPTSGP